MSRSSIVIKGAREHNLANIDLTLPRGKLIVITGLSGSGKSSLAFDTIYAEGQRRYVESLSAYARQFLDRMEKPDVDHIEGLSPAIAIEQKSVSKNPRSTVGTVTEIYDYLRLLFARAGVAYCYGCGEPISSMSAQTITDRALAEGDGARLQILAPIAVGRKGTFQSEFEKYRARGFARARVDGRIVDLSEPIELEKNRAHDIDILIDRISLNAKSRERLADAIEIALSVADGVVIINHFDRGEDKLYSENFACAKCAISYPELHPRLFSFNSPQGACRLCHGLGQTHLISADLVAPDQSRSIAQGAILPWSSPSAHYYRLILESVAERFKIDLNAPFGALSEREREIILYGSGKEKVEFNLRNKNRRHSYKASFEGVIGSLARRYKETDSQYIREEIESYMRFEPCSECAGSRLRKEALAIRVGSKNIMEFCSLSIQEAHRFIRELKLSKQTLKIVQRVVKEIEDRLRFLDDVGLSYLTLERKAGTLSGGEAQRIRLATQIGSALAGALYALDEPSIGLHNRDNQRLIKTLRAMRDLGNTVIVVEHDRDTIEAADYLVDLGPGAGRAGGRVVSAGSVAAARRNKKSLTGQYLCGKRSIERIAPPRTPMNGSITIKSASENNLKSIDVNIPLGLFTVVTGVSGSGKSSLIIDILYRALAKRIYRSTERIGAHKTILGLEKIDKAIDIDQSPIGKTPRSVPATYTGLMNHIREFFAALPDSRRMGYQPSRFSFNVKGGRCDTCQGAGAIRIDMSFLADVYVRCDACKGSRYNRETLQIEHKGKNIAAVLDMTVTEALDFFKAHPSIMAILDTMRAVGLDYIKLGQNSTTLSGGEAQRVKLSTELAKRATGQTLYLLDEPTTGLHFEDTRKLIITLDKLVEAGNTLVVIEHNIDLIKCADWIIDLGPEGGDGGGRIVAEGSPASIAAVKESHTGQALREAELTKNRNGAPRRKSRAKK